MKNELLNNLIQSIKIAQPVLSQLTPAQRAELEDKWDIEHAYYSSVLAGNRLDREEFDKLD